MHFVDQTIVQLWKRLASIIAMNCGRVEHCDLCCVSKRLPNLSLSISLPNINQFSKLFYWHILEKICYNVIVKYPTTF